MTKLATKTVLMWEGYLVITLSPDWVNVFKCMPTFDAYLDQFGKLHLVTVEQVQK